ncbi:MAG: ABC transporter ATP-binding protein [Spirochaetia bacterium]
MTNPVLSASKLNKSFGGLQAVNGVSFTAEPGSITAVIGPNGAGKTTLFNLISGFIVPDSGNVFFKGAEITGKKPYQAASLGILRTFQAVKMPEKLSVLDNVMLGTHRYGKAGYIRCMLHTPGSVREERKLRQKSIEVLATLGLSKYADTPAGSLSFGDRRTLEMARALTAEPEILLLDEPASGLNPRETENLAGLILSVRKKGVSVLLVEHDMSLVMEISDYVYVLNFGNLVASGTPREIQSNKEVIKIYLGEDEDA